MTSEHFARLRDAAVEISAALDALPDPWGEQMHEERRALGVALTAVFERIEGLYRTGARCQRWPWTADGARPAPRMFVS